MAERSYKIGEAAQILKLKSYVLRFWETEFRELNPSRTDKGQRLYSEMDLALLKRIRHLLHERGLTIEGARRALSEAPRPVEELSGGMLGEVYEDFYDDDKAGPGLAARGTDAGAEAAKYKAILAETLSELKSLRAFLKGE